MQIHSPDALLSNGGISFFAAYSPHHSPGPSLYITWLIYPLTLQSISNSAIAQIHGLLQSRCAASTMRVLALIIAIQATGTLQRWCLWATREHHIFCTYTAQYRCQGHGTGINRCGIWQARGRYGDGVDLCHVCPLNEEIGILLMESAAGIRPKKYYIMRGRDLRLSQSTRAAKMQSIELIPGRQECI